MKTIKLEVYGRVQGINFRSMTKGFADSHGIKGYVMNRDDGGVEIVAQGSDEKLKKLIAWLKADPGMSKVEKVDTKEMDRGEFDGFEIKREGNFFSDKKKALGNFGKRLF